MDSGMPIAGAQDEPDAHPNAWSPAGGGEREEAFRSLGIWSATLLALALSLTWALSVPAFWGVDETSHVAYAVAAAGGEWPTINTANPVHDFPGLADRIDYDISFGRLGRLDIWTSNHPPLYFFVVGIPLRLGLLVDHAGAGLIVARVLTAVAGSAGVLAVAWVARALAPGRPRVEVIAAFCAALAPTLVHYAGQVYNDTLGFTLSTIGLAAGFAALRHGLTRRLLVIGTVSAGAGALTRSSGLAVAALAVAAFMLAAWFDGRHQEDAMSRRLPRLVAAVKVGVLSGGGVALIAGWAVVVNLVRYGDPTAASALFDKFDRTVGPDWLYILTRGQYLIDQIDRFATELSIGVWWPSVVTRITYVVLTAAVIGGLLAGHAWWRARRRPDARAVSLGVLAVALPVLLLAASAVFISQGGYPHSRYLLPALGTMAALAATGIDGLPGARRGVPALATLSALVVANIALWIQFLLDHQMWYQEVFPFAELPALAPVWLAVAVGTSLGTLAVVGLVRAINGLSPDPDHGRPGDPDTAASPAQHPAAPLKV